ncbi:MAG: hypothetical protein LAT55_12825 [Opitutales bacterium]|nr:hypothetical protein [Opitutales bacterium]
MRKIKKNEIIIICFFVVSCIILVALKFQLCEETIQVNEVNAGAVFSFNPKVKFWDVADEITNSLNEHGSDRQFVVINGVSFSLPPFSFYKKRSRALYMGNDENKFEFNVKEEFSYNYKRISENQGDYAKVFIGDEVLLHEVTLLKYMLHEHKIDADFLRKEDGSGMTIQILINQ